MSQLKASEIADRLAAQAESVVRELLPGGKVHGHEWCVGSINGEAGESLKVQLQGDRVGKWKDFASSEKGGDLLDLWAASRGCDIGTAIRQAKDFLGIRDPVVEEAGIRKSYKKVERDKSIRSVSKHPVVLTWLTKHRLTDKSIKAYKIAAKDSDTLAFPFMRCGDDTEVVHMQYRTLKKKGFWASEGTEMILFGWQAMPPMAREVIICEGMKDAMSWYEYGYNALSVPAGGGGNGKQNGWLASEYDNLARFDKIYLSMDADKAGQEALATIVERLGRHRCFIIRLPEGKNDINDCLKDQVAPEIIHMRVKNARTLDPSSLVNIGDFTKEIIEQFHPPGGKTQGILSPFEDHVGCFEFPLGATTILVGRNGGGKSTLAGQIILDACNQNFNCCVASLEFRVAKYASWIIRQGTCANTPSPSRIQQANEKLAEHLWAFSPDSKSGHGSAKVEKIIETFEYAAARYGCKLFVLDNFSKLVFSGKDELKDQKDAITLITEFAVQSNVHVLVVAHPRKSSSSDSGDVSSMDVRGHGALTDLPDSVLIHTRNKRKELMFKDRATWNELPADEQQRIRNQPDAWLKCEKQRHYNGTGDGEPLIQLYFDHESRQFTKLMNGMPKEYL
jgi:twinkle protein